MKTLFFCILMACGISLSVYAEGKWTIYTTGSTQEFDPESVYALAIEGDYIWCGTYWGVVKWNRKNGSFTRYTTEDGLLRDSIWAVAIDRKGVKWFGHFGVSGISSFDNVHWTRYTKETVPEMAAYETSTTYNWGFRVNDIVVDPENTVYFSATSTLTRQTGHASYYMNNLLVLDNGTWTILPVEYNGESISLLVDPAYPDTVWYCKEAYGSGYFVKPAYKFIPLSWVQRSGLEIGGVCMAMDKDRSIWYGYSGKVNVFTRTYSAVFTTEETGILCGNGYIQAIAVDKYNAKWFGSPSGLTRHDGVTWKTCAPEGWTYNRDSSYSDCITALAFDDDGVLWAGTNKGLYRFEETPLAVEEEKSGSLRIDSVRPNPFNPAATITFTLSRAGETRLSVYDITGRKVRELVSGYRSAGAHTAIWDGRDERGSAVSSGVYISMLECCGRVGSAKMVLMR